MDRSVSYIRDIWLEMSELNANNVDPDQTPRSVASDLGLHCLPMSLLWDSRLKLVNRSVDFSTGLAICSYDDAALITVAYRSISSF